MPSTVQGIEPEFRYAVRIEATIKPEVARNIAGRHIDLFAIDVHVNWEPASSLAVAALAHFSPVKESRSIHQGDGQAHPRLRIEAAAVDVETQRRAFLEEKGGAHRGAPDR